MTSTPYYSYIISLINTKIKGVYDEGCRLINDKIENWPRNDSYQEFIDNIVYIGSKVPLNSIETIKFLVDNLESENLRNIFQVEKDDEIEGDDKNRESKLIKKNLYKLLIYYIFADSVVQLMMYTEMDNKVLNDGLYNICGINILNMKFPNIRKNKPNFDLLLQRLIRQCSVIYYKVRLINEPFNGSLDIFTSTLANQEAIDLISSRENLLILNRYLEPPQPDKNNDISFSFIEAILNCHSKSKFQREILEDCIKSAILQLPKNDYSAVKNKQFNDIISNKSNIDFKALFMARNTTTKIEDIKKFLDDNKRQDRDKYLRSFLYFLRDPKCKPMNELWEYGKRNDNYFLIEEKNGLSEIKETNEAKFVDLFFTYIANKIDNDELSTKIIFNLLSRNILDNIQRFATYLIDNNKGTNEKIAGPFFNALSIIFDPQSGFVNNTDDSNTIKAITNTLKTFIKGQYETSLPSIIKDLTYCKTVSTQSCPDSLLANQDIDPQISVDGFIKRFKEAENLTSTVMPQNYLRPNYSDGKPRSNAFPEEWKIKTYLITILFHIINPSDATADFFVPLAKMALGDCQKLAYFALYALQVFYIKKEYTVLPILSAINIVMKELTLGKKNAFTLLNLLNQFLTLPILHIENERDNEWLANWSNETQAILLAHLTSPFAQVRDMSILVMERLNTVLSSFNIQTTITSLLHKYDPIMMQRIAYRLKTTNNSNETFENINFVTICRSTKIYLILYALVEYAQVLVRSDMKNVLKSFYQLKLWSTINWESNDLWDILPVLSFSQRICPMLTTSKEKINANFNCFPGSHSLLEYEIYKEELTIDDVNMQMIDDIASFSNETRMKKLIESLDKENRFGYDVLGALANSLSIELLPNFIKSFIKYIKTARNDSILVQKRISHIITGIVLSSDFILFVSAHMDELRDLYEAFLNWYHDILKKYERNHIDIDFSDESPNREFLQGYCSCVQSLSQSLLLPNNNGIIGAVRSFKRPPWFTDDNICTIKTRQICFEYLRKKEPKAEKAILSLIEVFSIFNSEFSADDATYRYFLDLEIKNPNVRAFHSLLIHHRDMFWQYLKVSLHIKKAEGYYLFRAICEYFVYNNRDVNVDDLSPEDIKLNRKIVDNSGRLVLYALVFIGSPHDEIRKSAFALLKRILPILCAFQDKDNIRTSGNINSYLIQHQSELSAYTLEPTKEQVYDLASCISDNMPFIVPKIFETFFSMFKLYNGDDDADKKPIIGNSYIPLLLNVVSPFARHLIFEQGTTVYSYDFHSTTSMKGIDFINNLIDIYPYLKKNNIPYYTKIFGEICTRQANIEVLARLLIINSGATRKDTLLTATTTILLYLIQNANPAVFLSLLVQRLSFGYWFTSRYGQTEIIADQPYNVYDWIDLTLNILHEVALANFSLLFPYIHTILHYCIIFNNHDQTTNSRLASLLQIIINNIDSSLLLPENCKIGFQARSSSDMIPVSGIIDCLTNPLEQLISTSIKSWKNEALQWQTSCGDLVLSERSAVVYSLLPIDPEVTDNDKILNSLNIVLKEYQANLNLLQQNKNIFFGYIHGSLEMLLSNIKFSFEHNLDESIHDILQVSLILIDSAIVDEETSRLALKLVKIIINELPNKLQNLSGLARLMATSFNRPNIVKILVKLITSNSQNQILALTLLLPYFYASITAFQSISPYLTFITSDIVSVLIKKPDCAAIQLSKHTFEKGSKYAEIFQKYFKLNEKGVDLSLIESIYPLEFISELTKEIWASNPESILEVIAYYKVILTITYTRPTTLNGIDETYTAHTLNVVRETIYYTLQAFIQTCPQDKLNEVAIFNSILNYAIYEDSPASRDLMLADVTNSIPIEGNPSLLSKFISPHVDNQNDIVEQIMKDVGFAVPYRAYIEKMPCKNKRITENNNSTPIYEIDFSKESPISVLMICDGLPNHFDDQIKSLKGIHLMPFEEQILFWKAIKNEKFTPKVQPIDTDITALQFFTHAKARNAVKKTADQIYAQEKFFDKDCFILKDEEFDLFEKRLESKE